MPRVEHCGVDIAMRDSVVDAEEHELPVSVRVDLLPCGCDQRVEIRLSEVPRDLDLGGLGIRRQPACG
ncbi:MAG TPA: hypothetical protein VFI54_03715 [Solirubrobacteraceae bacterium]|nr:hypothetical protein [Solirubrobacteraceae bacterium]